MEQNKPAKSQKENKALKQNKSVKSQTDQDAVKKPQGELTDEQLEQVVGGHGVSDPGITL